MSIVDAGLESLAGWGTHTQADGSNIGGTPPTKYGFYQGIPGDANAMMFYIEGAAYADWEAYIKRPVQANTGNLSLSFDLVTDSNAALYAQAIETDTILTVNGFSYNFSMQNNYAEGGMLQIAKAGGGWVDTGIKPGKYTPHVTQHVVLNYVFNATAKTGSVTSIAVNGVIGFVPGTLQNVPAVSKGWGDGAIFQKQLDLNSKGGSYSTILRNITYTWN